MIAKNPDVRDAGCPSCDYGLPQACTCEESLGSEGKALRGEAGSSDQQPTSDPRESTAARIVQSGPGNRGPVTMATADYFERRGQFALAEIARKYAVDRPRWWHRFTRRSK